MTLADVAEIVADALVGLVQLLLGGVVGAVQRALLTAGPSGAQTERRRVLDDATAALAPG